MLVLVLMAVLVGQLVGGPRSAEAAVPIIPAESTVTTEPSPAPLTVRRAPIPNLPSTPVRDLFSTNWSRLAPVAVAQVPSDKATPAGPAKPPPRWVLELTLTDPTEAGKHSAVINGRRVVVGDKILGLSVDTITPGIVILVGDKNERIVLEMN